MLSNRPAANPGNVTTVYFSTQPFATLSKVYACSGEPCCAKCVTPVFDETWTPHSSPTRMLSERRRGSHVGSLSTSRPGSMSTVS